MNNVQLVGRLGRDPEVRYSQGNKSTCIARYTLAVRRKFKNADGEYDTDWINCVAFGASGEFAEKYFKKGMLVGVSGRIQTGSYEKDGRTVYTTDIVVEDQEFCESKKDGNSATPPSKKTPKGDEDFMKMPEGDEEELPFS